jgi:hypothetical protein
MAASGPVDQTDLKEVRGIGRKVEARLKAAGIMDLGQLARTPANELAAILAGLPGKFDTDRILRENWVAQAAALAAHPAGQAETVETMAPIRHNFTVEVRRAVAGGRIESSRVVHVQTGDEETWRGWSPQQQLVAFIEERSGMLPAARPERAEEEARSAAGVAAGTRETGRKAGHSLHTFAMVLGSGLDMSLRGPISATLIFDPATIHLPAGQAVEVMTEVFVRQRPPAKSLLVGRSRMQTGGAGPVRFEIPCELPVAARPTAMFAAVRVLAAAADARRSPSRGLADASLEISAPSVPS